MRRPAKTIDQFDPGTEAHREAMVSDPNYARQYHKALEYEREQRRHDSAHHDAMAYDPSYARQYHKKTRG